MNIKRSEVKKFPIYKLKDLLKLINTVEKRVANIELARNVLKKYPRRSYIKVK